MATIAPIHPGEVLLEDFLTPLEVTQHHLAISIGCGSPGVTFWVWHLGPCAG